MGYLDNSIITVDAILTKVGRERLAAGDGSFNITKFALSDDEVDYSLYNTNHPSGSAYYGEAIENMPMLEAFVNGAQDVKYKLVTLAKGQQVLPQVTVNVSAFEVTPGTTGVSFSPRTANYLGNQLAESGYTVTLLDSRYINLVSTQGNTTYPETNTSTNRGVRTSTTAVGLTFMLTAPSTLNVLNLQNYRTSLIITGNDSGQQITVPVSIKSYSTTSNSTQSAV